MVRKSVTVGMGALSAALATAASAQEGANNMLQSTNADSDMLGEIVVTAQKRSESLQKVPLAITVVNAADLERSGIKDLEGVVAVVPNLNLGRQLGIAKIALRGIGLENVAPAAEGSIAFHVDGVFVSRSIAALSSFYDIEQVEVLRGPQGTLYGRNATGGSINLTTRGPTQKLSGYANITYGNYNRIVAEGAIGGALVPDVLAARIALQTQDRDGYGKNIADGRDIDDLKARAVRGNLLFTPSDRLSIDIKADYLHERDSAGGYRYLGGAGFTLAGAPVTPLGIRLGGSVPTNIRDIDNDIRPQNFLEFWGVSGKLTYELGGGTELRSLTAYRETDYLTTTDLDSTRIQIASVARGEKDRQFSQEFQLAGKADRINWLLGFFYFHENDDGVAPVPFNNLAVGAPLPGTFVQGFFAGGTIMTDALAVFGQASYEVADDLRLTLGARYSSEKKRSHDIAAFDTTTPYNPAAPLVTRTLDQSKRFKSFTPRVALDYQVNSDTLIYASWSKGFKAGTYNLGSLTPPVNPEKVSAVEGGVKSMLFDRRVRLNVAGFYYNYKDLQIGKIVNNSARLENAATATIYGLEAELQAKLSDRVEINASGAWLHARFDKYISADPARSFGDRVTFVDAAGNFLPGATATTPGARGAFNLRGNSLSQAPDFTFFLGAQYALPTDVGAFRLRGELSWRDRVYFTPFNVDKVGQAAHAKVNAFINWQSNDDHWKASLFVKNLTDKTTVANSFVATGLVGFAVNGYLDEPRTYGLTVGYKF